MKTYDFAFSLGFSCGTSQALRAAGLQFASYPLDWVGSPGVVESAQVVADRFRGWMEAEDLQLWDVRHGVGFCTRIYRNRKNLIGFSHEFSDFIPFSESYPKVRETYDRRAERFLERLNAAGKALAVYLELPFRECASAETLDRALSILRGAFPGKDFELLYFYEDPSRKVPAVVSEGSGVTVVAADYRKFDEGEITHFVEFAPLAGYLRSNVSVPDTRTEKEKSAYFAKAWGDDSWRWGIAASPLRRWWNQRLYKLYRGLEKVLRRRGMVHREGPLWFVDR